MSTGYLNQPSYSKKIEANGLKKGGNKHPPRPLHHIWSKLRTFKGYNLQKITRNQLQVRLKVVSAKNSLKTSKEGTFFSIFWKKEVENTNSAFSINGPSLSV